MSLREAAKQRRSNLHAVFADSIYSPLAAGPPEINMSKNILPHKTSVSAQERSAIKGHKPAVLWFTGLSGSGKSTVANAVDLALNQVYRAHTYLLDGDNIRTGLNRDLGFSLEDRTENIRRIGEVACLLSDAGLIVLTAFISPLRADRQAARDLLRDKNFLEIYVNCPLEECMRRDPKGLYQKAQAGEIPEFTGITSPYEPPETPDLVLDTSQQSLEACVAAVVEMLQERGIVGAERK
jgi:adenylyl-sulfate kinase